MVRVKICGITNIEDAMAAVEAGADALGFVFAESPRKVEMHRAWHIIQELPPMVSTIGVWADADVDEVCDVMDITGLHFVQLHGKTRGSVIQLGGWRIIRALRVQSDQDIREAAEDELISRYAGLFLDSHVEGLMGGTGRTFDWNLAVQAKSLDKPIILAGGLTPENVGEAVRRVRPYAVDVSTGVEKSPGKKDHDKIKEFILNAKNA